MSVHTTEVGRGSAGKYCVICDACNFNPEWTTNRADAERWAAEHVDHPDRDVSGIWAWDRWRAIGGINHGFPFGCAACGAPQPPTDPADDQLPSCEVCQAMVPDEDDIFGSWSWKNWRMLDGVNHAVPFGRTACGAGQPAVLAPDPSLPICPVCDGRAPAERVRWTDEEGE